MIAIIFIMGTKYDCNDDQNEDLIWMQSGFQKGTKYGCNFKSKTDHICLQSLSIAIIYACKHSKFNLWDSFKNHDHVTSGRFLTLQAYLVPIERVFKHIKFLFWPGFQTYLVHVIKIIATLCGAFLYFCPITWPILSKSRYIYGLLYTPCYVGPSRSGLAELDRVYQHKKAA